MTRDELEHIIRASADVTGQHEFIIVGSQSILGSVANPQEVFTMSAEADTRRGQSGTQPNVGVDHHPVAHRLYTARAWVGRSP